MTKVNLSREEIKAKVIKIVKDNLPEFKETEIKEETKLNTQKALDSMTFIYLMCKIEAEFDIKIPQKKWSKMQTLSDVLDEIEKAK